MRIGRILAVAAAGAVAWYAWRRMRGRRAGTATDVATLAGPTGERWGEYLFDADEDEPPMRPGAQSSRGFGAA